MMKTGKIAVTNSEHSMNQELKTCRRCEVEKNSHEFTLNSSESDGLNIYCRKCCQAAWRKSMEKRKEKQKVKPQLDEAMVPTEQAPQLHTLALQATSCRPNLNAMGLRWVCP